tara:strand:- start:680 stop:1009 length:330 start_codon:yes stop_codon:yes gene_type:complete
MSKSYQSETLGHLEAWLTDAINSETTSKDVYDTLINTVKTEIKYHRECQKRAENLLLLLKGNLSALYDKEVNGDWYGQQGDETFEETLQREGYEYTPLTNAKESPYDVI